MPYIQPQTNNYFGFAPAQAIQGGQTQTNYYLVSSSESIINAGDVVVQSSINTAKSVAAFTGAFNPTSSAAMIGVAAMTLLAGGGSTAANLNTNTSAFLLVYDQPGQVFVVCDTTSGVIGTQVGLYKNYPILTTGAVGSTGGINAGLANSRSNMAISGVVSSAAGAFHVISMHPVEQGIYSTVGAATAGSAVNVRKWMGVLVNTVTVQSTAITSIANTTS